MLFTLPSETRELDLHIIYRITQTYTSLRDHKVVVTTSRNFMYKDLIDAIEEKEPLISFKTKERFRIYARCGTCDFIPIFDFMTMVSAFRIMDDLKLNDLYMVRFDDVLWESHEEDSRPPKFDPMIIFAYYPNFAVKADLSQVKPQHEPFEPAPLRAKQLPRPEDYNPESDKKRPSRTGAKKPKG